MSSEAPSSPPNPSIVVAAATHELRHLRTQWWWFVLLGVLLVLSGTLSVVYPAFTSLAAVIVLGMSLLVCGVATIVAAFWAGKWSAYLLQLLIGILYAVVGFIIMDTPEPSVVGLTVFVAAMFVVVGIMRSIAALTLRFPQWGWALLSGLISTLLGVFIYKHLPEAAFWAIGTLIGIQLLFDGWYWIMIGWAIRQLPASGE